MNRSIWIQFDVEGWEYFGSNSPENKKKVVNKLRKDDNVKNAEVRWFDGDRVNKKEITT